MKILHMADLHLGKHMNGFSLIEDQHFILNKILQIVKEKSVDCVLIAGDIYDKTMPSVEAVRLLDDFLTKLIEEQKKIFMISGNHDAAARIAFGGRVMKQAGVYVSPVFDGCPEPIKIADAWGEINVYLLPFVRPAVVRAAFASNKMEEAGEPEEIENITSYQAAVRYIMNRIQLDKRGRNILVAHQFLTGASLSESEEFSVGGLENIEADMFREFDYTALGHIHRAQKVLLEKIRYAGTPLKYSFSEANQQKSVTLVTMEEKGHLEVEEIPLIPLRDCRKIKGSYNEITAKRNYIHTNTEDYLHITLTDEEDILQVVSKLRIIYPNLMKVEYDNTRTRQNMNIEIPNIEKKESAMELLDQFYALQNNQPMTSQQYQFAEKILKKIKGEDE